MSREEVEKLTVLYLTLLRLDLYLSQRQCSVAQPGLFSEQLFIHIVNIISLTLVEQENSGKNYLKQFLKEKKIIEQWQVAQLTIPGQRSEVKTTNRVLKHYWDTQQVRMNYGFEELFSEMGELQEFAEWSNGALFLFWKQMSHSRLMLDRLYRDYESFLQEKAKTDKNALLLLKYYALLCAAYTFIKNCSEIYQILDVAFSGRIRSVCAELLCVEVLDTDSSAFLMRSAKSLDEVLNTKSYQLDELFPEVLSVVNKPQLLDGLVAVYQEPDQFEEYRERFPKTILILNNLLNDMVIFLTEGFSYGNQTLLKRQAGLRWVIPALAQISSASLTPPLFRELVSPGERKAPRAMWIEYSSPIPVPRPIASSRVNFSTAQGGRRALYGSSDDEVELPRGIFTELRKADADRAAAASSVSMASTAPTYQ